MADQTPATVRPLVYAVQSQFEKVRIDRSIPFAREAEFAIQALDSGDYTRTLAASPTGGLREALMQLGTLGLSLNPAKKHAYLIPRKDRSGAARITVVVSYMGLVALATSTGSLSWVQANVVRDGETFIDNGYGEAPVHKREPFAKDKGAIIGAYCVARTPDGSFLTTTMDLADIHRARAASDSWQAHEKKGTQTPWVAHEAEMIKKTVVRLASKLWPNASPALQEALHAMDQDSGDALPEAEGAMPGDSLDALLAAARRAPTAQALKDEYLRAVREVLRPSGDLIAYGQYRAVVDELMQAFRTGARRPADVTDVEPKPAAVDPATLEPGSFAHVQHVLQAAVGRESLEAAAELLEFVEDPAEHETLAALLAKRRAEFGASA